MKQKLPQLRDGVDRLTEDNALWNLGQAVENLKPYPGGHSGTGIVIPAGGTRYLPCAWVCIRMLRKLGCDLPIELWHLGAQEMPHEVEKALLGYNVICRDAWALEGTNKPVLGGWELKCYAILHSAFREVMLLDADNFPVADPTYLFAAPQYHEQGAVFWPDYGRLGPDRAIWRLTGIPFLNEPEFESGQIVVNKERCWRPLSLAMWFNEHSKFWYRYVHGDKETFHLAWRRLGCDYAMIQHPIRTLRGVMCQHDFKGKRIFQHRNLIKWKLDRPNLRIPGFLYEDDALALLEELRGIWTTRPRLRFDRGTATDIELALANKLCSENWSYRRLGYDEREMSFCIDGSIAMGAAGCEEHWNISARDNSGEADLIISGSDQVTCRLQQVDGGWKGSWIIHEHVLV